MGYGLRTPIEAPPALRRNHGLIASGQRPTNTDERWDGGFEFAPRRSGLQSGVSLPDCTKLGVDLAGDPADPPALVPGEAFVLTQSFKCEAWVAQNPQAAVQTALATMSMVEERLLEEEFMTNPHDKVTPHLSDSTTVSDLSVPAGVSPRRALQQASQALASIGSGGAGYLHCTTSVAAALSSLGLVRESGGVLTTYRGDIVVDGAGYSGFGPDVGAGPVDPGDATLQWMYVTSPVVVRLGEVWTNVDEANLSDGIDRAENTIELTAFRHAAAYFDPAVHFGIIVDVTLGE